MAWLVAHLAATAELAGVGWVVAPFCASEGDLAAGLLLVRLMRVHLIRSLVWSASAVLAAILLI